LTRELPMICGLQKRSVEVVQRYEFGLHELTALRAEVKMSWWDGRQQFDVRRLERSDWKK
jgi:hypothetical protein